MEQKLEQQVCVYIPNVVNYREITKLGGLSLLKRKICEAFAKRDSDGAMSLGVVKKVELVKKIVKADDTMMTEDGLVSLSSKPNPHKNIVSAYIRFVPSNTKAATRRIQQIRCDEGLKYMYDEKRMAYWVILEQRKSKNRSKCPNCGQNQETNKMNMDMADLFDRLTCDDGPSKKRHRIMV